MTINVNTKIGVGAVGSVNNQTSIGTDGLTMCVGLIAVGTPPGTADELRTCAHFSSGFGGPSTPERIAQAQQATTAILEENFAVDSTWSYTNHTPNDWTATAIIDACTAFFDNAANQSSREHETITMNAAGIILISDDNVVGGNNINNENAEVDPPILAQTV